MKVLVWLNWLLLFHNQEKEGFLYFYLLYPSWKCLAFITQTSQVNERIVIIELKWSLFHHDLSIYFITYIGEFPVHLVEDSWPDLFTLYLETSNISSLVDSHCFILFFLSFNWFFFVLWFDIRCEGGDGYCESKERGSV